MKTLYKRLISYFKSDWKLEDYPIRYREQKIENFRNPSAYRKWHVQIIKWWVMGGLGDTKTKAYSDLKQNFENFKRDMKLPRPGVEVPIEFVPFDKLEAYEDIAEEFFNIILNISYKDCFITNESCLGHFTYESLINYDKKINDYYDLNIKNSEEILFIELFELINKKKKGSAQQRV